MIRRPLARFAALLCLLAALCPASPAHADARRWVPVAKKSEVSFWATHPFGGFIGSSEDVSGEFKVDTADLRGVTGMLSIQVTSLRTDDKGRDRDMRQALAADRFPEIRFTIERVEPTFPSVTDRSDVLLTITGLMQIHGVERQVVFPARVRIRDEKLWVRGETRLRMSEFGIKPPKRMLFAVGDSIGVGFDVTLAPE